MKRVLIIKMSSLGDVLHTLPALTDAFKSLDNVQFDWVVEEKFSEIPAWHPAVNRVIPVALRRWRKHLFNTLKSGEWQTFRRQLQANEYDAVIDAQGLIKSAFITRLARGHTFGLDKRSARESVAAWFYQHPLFIPKDQHAVERVRQLFAKALDYSVPDSIDYGIRDGIRDLLEQKTSRLAAETLSNRAASNKNAKCIAENKNKQILFFHGTTWDTKHWPEKYWFELAGRVTEIGYEVVIPWGNELEHQRALRIQRHCNQEKGVQVKCGQGKPVRVLDKMNLNELVKQINSVVAVVAVDTGLAHLSAALDKPTIALYGPTSPGLTGTYGNNQCHLKVDYECSPCFKKMCDKKKDNINPECYTRLTPEKVMNALNELLIRSYQKKQLSYK